MFGHQDDKDGKKDGNKAAHEETIVTPDNADQVAPAQTDDASAATDTPAADAGTDDNEPAANTEEVTDDNAWQHPGSPLTEEEGDEENKGPAPIEDIIGGANAGPDFKPSQHSSDFHGSDSQTDNTPHDLIDIKQKALTELMPLVGELDQSPEDRFRTLLMMVQASDDQALVKSAYEAAHEIKDEKVRAQALLDIVNEINYFTQHPEN